MNNGNRFDSTDELDIEIAKSVEKLIDEETSVAKAFVDRDMGPRMHNDTLGKTQVIPNIDGAVQTRNSQQSGNSHTGDRQQSGTRQTSGNRQQSGNRPSGSNQQSSGASQSVRTTNSRNGSQSGPPAKRQSGKNTRKKSNNSALIMLIVGVLVLAILVLVIVSFVLNNKKLDSYDYNYSTGLGFYNSGNYTDALTYWEKAATDSEGRRNVNLKIKMYECYAAVGNKDRASEMLKDALSYDKYNEKALVMLAEYYTANKDGEALTAMLRKYKGTDGEKYLKNFEVAMPSASEASGKFDRLIELELNSVNSYKIYYTTDGTSVTTKSKEYVAPVRIEKGKTTIKAVAVDANGTMSYELELVFDVDYKNPDAPMITPQTGTYGEGTKIEITNIPEGAKAYYTLDGTTPTKESQEYTEPVLMPEKNTVFSAVIIDEFDLVSAVTKRNYNVGVTTKYTFDESVDKLKITMIAKGDLNSDGTSADGGQARFTYYKKTSIANVEMYITFYDIIKNGVTTRQTYYFGIDVVTGKCYKVYDQGDNLIATEY